MTVKKGTTEKVIEILIVEDSPTQAEQLKYLLEQHSYSITVANNGKEALDQLDKHIPALVITDIVMPGMDGYELCQKIKSDNKTRGVPVILLTSLTNSEDVLEGLACGADNFITKPYSEKYLLSAISQIYANRKLSKIEPRSVNIEILFAGKTRSITADQQQILSLLLSTYEAAVNRNKELIQAQEELKTMNERLEEMVDERTAELMADITERKRAEERLREEEERFRIAAETSNDVVYEWDLKQNVQWFGKIDEMLGYGPGEFPQTLDAWAGSVHPEDLERTMAAVRAHLEEGLPYNEEYRVRRIDGAIRWWSARGAATRTPDGKPVRWVGTVTDITERKQAAEALQKQKEELEASNEELAASEEELRTQMDELISKQQELVESEQKFHDTIKYLDEGYYSVTSDGLLLDHNQAFNRILGIDAAQDMRGGHLPDFWQNPDDRREYLNELMTKGFILNYLINAKKINGEKVVVIASAHQVKDEKGKLVRIEGTFVDFTVRKRAEEEIQRLNETLEDRVRERTANLEAANRELEFFSYSVSHDLRAPLRSIDGFSQVIMEDYAELLDEKGREYLNRMRAASQRMALLIDDILNLSRLGRAEMRREPVDLSAIARLITGELAAKEPERVVEAIIADNVTALGDPALLKIAMENLFTNAWKFTSGHSRARIEFGIAENNGRKEYFIRDDGAGFDMKYADRLFGAFQRLHSTAEFEGTGIGLALVQRIINRHRGTIRAEGSVEKGAAIYFTLGTIL